MELSIALQSGAMKAPMMQLFEDAFLPVSQEDEACFDGMVRLGDLRIRVRFMKSSSIPGEVVSGEFHCGITGRDVIYQARMEEKAHEITELHLARRTNQSARVVLAGIAGAKLEGSVTVYVDAEYSRLAEDLIQSSTAVQAKLVIQAGTSEEKVRGPGDFAIIATETGSSLAANGLEVVQVLMESCMVLFVRKGLCESDQEMSVKVEDLGLLLEGILKARPRVLIKMNVPDDGSLEGVSSLLPSLTSPTQMPMRDGGHALEVVAFTDAAAELVPQLRRSGAEGILVQDLRMVVL